MVLLRILGECRLRVGCVQCMLISRILFYKNYCMSSTVMCSV